MSIPVDKAYAFYVKKNKEKRRLTLPPHSLPHFRLSPLLNSPFSPPPATGSSSPCLLNASTSAASPPPASTTSLSSLLQPITSRRRHDPVLTRCSSSIPVAEELEEISENRREKGSPEQGCRREQRLLPGARHDRRDAVELLGRRPKLRLGGAQ